MTNLSRAIEIGAKALREHDMAGRVTVEWDRIPNGQKKKWRKKAEAALSALAAGGFVVVPREPTTQQMEAAGNAVAEYAKKMTQAGGDVDATDYALRAVIYRAMIRATQEISNASD